jgi:predicted DsbA family dithiol-disulfide isomerase
VRWRYGAFELDPDIPAEGVDPRAYLEAKYGPESLSGIAARLEGVARSEGLAMMPFAEMSLRPNTLAAHRVMTAALEDGEQVQQALADALFAAHWARGEDIGDDGVLAAAAEAAGMAPGRAAAALAGDAYVAEVRAEQRRAAQLGIHAVPTFVFDGRFALSGAQPPEALAAAVRHAGEVGIDPGV